MKNLKEYILESSKDFIDESSDSSQFKLWKKTSQTIKEQAKIYDAFQKLGVELKKVSLNNKSERQKAFNKFVNSLPFGSKTRNLDVLSKYDIKDDESWGKLLLMSHDELEKNHIGTSWIKQWDLTNAEKAYKKAKENGEIPDKVDDDDYDERDLVIYDRWNPKTHSVYEFTGKRGKATDHQVNMIRVDFHYEYDVKYYDCYPILAKNYYGHESELKNRARIQLDFEEEKNQ